MPQEHGVRWFPDTPKREQHALVEQIEAWFETDEAQGLYVCQTTWPDELDQHPDGRQSCHVDKIGSTWFFTDPNTALAFKLRFM
jgi:hypothetical protein